MKKVLLVNTNRLCTPYPVPPLGLCLMAAVIEESYEVRLVDTPGHDRQRLMQTVRDFEPDYIGLSIRNTDNTSMVGSECYVDSLRDEFVEPLRAHRRTPIILGGSGFSIFPHDLLNALDADFGVAGEGEQAFPLLLHALDAGENPGAIPRVIVRNAPPSPRNWGTASELERMPFSRIDTRLNYAPYLPKSAYPIQTKRGCARRCVYCTYPSLEGTALRCRTPESVVDELDEARGRLGDITFEFVDSIWNAPPGVAESICREILRRQLRFELRTMGINPSHMTAELLELMKAAGFAQIDCTPDTASPAVLESMGKGFSRERLERSASLIREYDMPTMWFFMFGGPGETAQTIQDTFDFIDGYIAEDDLVHISEGIRIYPDTRLHAMSIEEGVLAPDASLLHPRFYVSPRLGAERLGDLISRALQSRPNCLRETDRTPPPDLLSAALSLRKQQGLTEPIFRTLIRLRRESWG